MRLIDADALIAYCDEKWIPLNIDAVNAQPTIEERKAGRWTSENACEFCGFQPWYENDIHTLSFCPHCGADMRGCNHETP